MDYTAEFSGPTTLINNIINGPQTGTPDTTLASLTPLEQERDLIVGHLANDFKQLTSQAVQSKSQVDGINGLRSRIKDLDGKKTSLQGMVQNATSELSSAKQNLNIQLAKQKIAFELLSVFAVTIVIYIMFGSSSYVHMIALVVVVFGFLYILNFNAYRLGAIGEEVGSTTLTFLGKLFIPDSPNPSISSESSFPNLFSFFYPPNADGPTSIGTDTTANHMKTASSLYSDSVV